MDRERTAELCAALGSEVRLQIVEFIAAHKEMCACELVDLLGLSQATISRHISVLRQAKVLRSRRLGSLVILRVDAQSLSDSFDALLERVRTSHAASAGLDAEARLIGPCATQRIT